jgi:hypothetical protein
MQKDMKLGFQHAENSLNAVWKDVGVLANTVGTVSTLVHNTMAIMDQREEQMKRDILGQIELSIIQTDMAIMRASDPDEKHCLSDKIKTLEARRNSIADECANMSLAIGHLIQTLPRHHMHHPLFLQRHLAFFKESYLPHHLPLQSQTFSSQQRLAHMGNKSQFL